MNILSLFDGISCGQLALVKAGIKKYNYYASEINKDAIKVTQHNFPNTIQLGDVRNIKNESLPKIDLLIGGSPCQGFSFAGNMLNFNDNRSKLFFEFSRLLSDTKPKYFFLENVRMAKKSEEVITKVLGVKPTCIDSSLVSAQSRKRLYWTNLPHPVIADRNIYLKNIYEPNSGKTLSPKTALRPRTLRNFRDLEQKAFCLTATMYKGSQTNGMTVIQDNGKLRCITPLECERLQNIPDNYTSILSNSKRYEVIGNGWTVDIIAEFFKSLK